MEIKYPELTGIANLFPSPQVLLGKRIYWTEKRDGTNLAVTLVDGRINLFTRHQEASEQFTNYFYETEQAESIRIFVEDYTYDTSSIREVNEFVLNPVVFGELLIKGKSPARFEVHDHHEFVVFDIWDSVVGRFLPYTSVYQHCYHYQIPVVECFGISRHTSLDSLYTFRDEMLLVAKENSREGVVLKTFNGDEHIFAKEKLDIPRIDRVQFDTGGVRLPSLPESEVMGAIAKAHADLGDVFSDRTQAMPLIAKYIEEEMKKHLCGKPEKRLYDSYLQYLEDRNA